MNPRRIVPHFDQINKSAIQAQFFDERRHRATLRLPYIGATWQKTLCIIGQNPSAADEKNADSTIRYLEELIHRTHPEYSELLVLNLYSRVDTTKAETSGILDARCESIFDATLEGNEDFLLIYGKLKNEGAYKFKERARHVSDLLKSKNVFKLDLDTPYPPHPGNPSILYRNLSVQLAPYQSGIGQ